MKTENVQIQASPLADAFVPPSADQPFVQGTIQTVAGNVPQVSGDLSAADRLGAISVRLGLGRMNYTVDPGLYGLGNPDPASPVLVTANYKLSFDSLRAAYRGRDAWILVLDTKGINVWCAAGKGTFGTRELVKKVKDCGLGKIVTHRKLIVPQLGAPGVAAHTVKGDSGFAVVYGPVKAPDLPAFMDAGQKATRQMRTKNFPLAERAVLIPVELMPTLKWATMILPVLFVLGGFGYADGFGASATTHGLLAVLMVAGGLLAGAVVTPLLLPWLPGRAFAAKGGLAGLIIAGIILMTAPMRLSGSIFGPLFYAEAAGLTLIAGALSAFLGMNFTGASTYTSLSGVRQEMRWAVPAQIAGTLLGLILWGAARFVV